VCNKILNPHGLPETKTLNLDGLPDPVIKGQWYVEIMLNIVHLFFPF